MFCFVCVDFYLEMICIICLMCLWRLFHWFRKPENESQRHFFSSKKCLHLIALHWRMVYIDTVTHLIHLSASMFLCYCDFFFILWRLKSICTPKLAIRNRIKCNFSHIIKAEFFFFEFSWYFLTTLQKKKNIDVIRDQSELIIVE